jgi:hypothetical protein
LQSLRPEFFSVSPDILSLPDILSVCYDRHTNRQKDVKMTDNDLAPGNLADAFYRATLCIRDDVGARPASIIAALIPRLQNMTPADCAAVHRILARELSRQ